MSICTHIQWLDLEGLNKDWSVMHADRLRTVARELPNPAHQYPSIIFFVGRQSKTAALQAIFRKNNITRHKTHGIGLLRADLTTIQATRPVLFTDCWPGATYSNLMGTWNGCHEAVRYFLNAVASKGIYLDALVFHIHARLLFDFVHVVCIFVDDLGGPHKATIYIKQWITAGKVIQTEMVQGLSYLLSSWRIQRQMCSFSWNVLRNLTLFFAALHLVARYADTELSSTALYLNLKVKLFSAIDDAHSERNSMRLSLSALHLPYLFTKALKVYVSAEAHFDWLDASRSFDEPQEDRTECIRDILTLVLQLPSTPTDVSSFVASALLMYCYPRGMHLFDPARMFDRVCHALCAFIYIIMVPMTPEAIPAAKQDL